MKRHLATLSCLLLAPSLFAQDTLYGQSYGGNWFGWSNDVDGDRLFIGAPRPDHWQNPSGYVQLFEREGQGWNHVQELQSDPADGETRFGWAVDASGNWLAVGAPRVDAVGEGPGSLYLYKKQSTGWAQVLRTHGIPEDQDRFGESLRMEDDTLFVGARRQDTSVVDGGAVFVYERRAGSWKQTQLLYPPDAKVHDFFGFSIDIDGDRAVVGAYQRDSAGLPGSGGAYVLEKVQGSWEFTATLEPFLPEAGGFFGRAVAVEGDLILVSSSTTVESFQYDGQEWELTTVQDGGQNYGHSVELIDGQAFVGSPGGNGSSGWFLVRRGSAFVSTLAYPAPDFTFHNFGVDLAGNTDWVVVGSHKRAGGGAAVVYEFESILPSFVESYCDCSTHTCGTTTSGGCENSTGVGAHMEWLGTTGIEAGDGIMNLTNLPAGQIGLVLMGQAQIQYPLDSGLLCVAGGFNGTFRYPVFGTGIGQFELGPDLPEWTAEHFDEGGHLRSGDTWNFQGWYRDSSGPCGGSSNFTNAVSVTFRP